MSRLPAEVFSPGEFIRDTLEDLGWTQEDLAEVLGRQPSAVADLISAKRELTVDWASDLAAAFDTSAEVWLNLEASYRLSLRTNGSGKAIRERSSLYQQAPIREMKRRGWISNSNDDAIIEEDLCQFFGVSTLEEEPAALSFAARKSTSYFRHASVAERAWVQRVVNLAQGLALPRFDADKLTEVFEKLSVAAQTEEGVEQVGDILKRHGIALVVVKHLKGTKLDGACVFVKGTPIVGLSIRYNRIDNFWFTLMHEMAHVAAGETSLDANLAHEGENDSNQMGIEVLANDLAANALINEQELSNALAAMSADGGVVSITKLAERLSVHPGILVGRLHHRGLLTFGQGRNHLVKIRDRFLATVPSDGWSTAN